MNDTQRIEVIEQTTKADKAPREDGREFK